MAVGAASATMAPGSLLAAAARRTARRASLLARPAAAHRARLAPSPAPTLAFARDALLAPRAAAHRASAAAAAAAAAPRRARVVVPRVRSLGAPRVDRAIASSSTPPRAVGVDASASPELDELDGPSDADADDAAPRAAAPAVLHSLENDLAVLEGVGASVPPGTLLAVGAAAAADGVANAVLLAHREPKTFALAFHVAADGSKLPGFEPGESASHSSVLLAPGAPVEVLSRLPRFAVPADDEVVGRRIGALGAPVDDRGPLTKGSSSGTFSGGESNTTPGGGGSELFREPPSVEDRKPITTPLITGVKALDALTPVGRGQCLLLTGEADARLAELAMHAIAAQSAIERGLAPKRPVRCVYAAVGPGSFEGGSAAGGLYDGGAGVQAKLEAMAPDAMARTTIVACAPEASPAERYAAVAAAFAVAEAARAEGRDVLLAVDDFAGLVGFPAEMGRLSPQLELEDADATEEQMVEYEGMIINALLAERRRFLGMTLQRVARMNDEMGGGSLTLLGAMVHEKGAYKGRRGGLKDSGDLVGGGGFELPAGFDDMDDALRAKIVAALAKKKEAKEAKEAEKAKEAEEASSSEAEEEYTHAQPRAVVEEFMSITDGQVMVEGFSPETGWAVSVKDSVSRIGSPGAAGPLMSLDMLQLRLDVMQADDMSVFGREGEEKSKMRDRSAAIRGLLRQRPGEAARLSAQTVGMLALRRGALDGMNADEAYDAVEAAVARARERVPEILDAIDEAPKKKLTDEQIEALAEAFEK